MSRICFYITMGLILSVVSLESAQAQTSTQGKFILKPATQWHYGVTQRGDIDVFGGCVFSMVYQNGFVLRLTENDGEVQRISFDFRQKVFKPKDVYPSKIEVADKLVLVPGVASSFSALDYKTSGEISTQELFLNKDKPLRVTIEGKEFIFQLSGLKEALTSLKDCAPVEKEKTFSPLVQDKPAQKPVTQVAAPAPQDLSLKQVNLSKDAPENQNTNDQRLLPVPSKALNQNQRPIARLNADGSYRYDPATQSPNDILNNLQDNKVASVSPQNRSVEEDPWGIKKAAQGVAESQKTEPKTLPVAGAARGTAPKILYKERKRILPDGSVEVVKEVPPVEVKKQVTAKWQAQSGESLETVLARWSRQAGVNLVWDSGNDFILPIDINSNKDFQETLAQTLALFDDQPVRPFGAMDFKADNLEAYKGKPTPKQIEVARNNRQWVALQGMDLRSVIEGWAASEGVRVVWLSQQRYNLKDDLKVRNGFTNAIEKALNQFSDQDIRPLAQLNTDPNTGEKVLFVNAKT